MLAPLTLSPMGLLVEAGNAPHTSTNETNPAGTGREMLPWVVMDKNGEPHPYYDALKRAISEAEFVMQSQQEIENGREYVTVQQSPEGPGSERP